MEGALFLSLSCLMSPTDVLDHAWSGLGEPLGEESPRCSLLLCFLGSLWWQVFKVDLFSCERFPESPFEPAHEAPGKRWML